MTSLFITLRWLDVIDILLVAILLYQLYYLTGSRGRLGFRPAHLRPDLALMRRMLLISVGGVGQFLIATSS